MARIRSVSLVIMLLGLSLSGWAGPASTQARSCISFYSFSIQPYIKKIQSLGDKLKKDSRWLAFPKAEPELQRLVERLIELSPVQQEQLRHQFSKIKSKHREYNKVILLALYDKQTWFDFLDRAMKGPLLDDSLVNSLIPIVRAMPEDLKSDVLAKVMPKYSGLSKVNFTTIPLRTNLRLAPKRSIDALILHIIKPDEWFQQDIQITQDPLESYKRYLQFLRTDIFVNSDRGNYSTSEIMTVAGAIQKVLREKAAHLDKPSITVTGSFPNGRAKIADTDLDSRLSHQELHQHLDAMSAAANEAMKTYEKPSHFTVEAMWATTTAHFAAQINPLFLKITPNEIQLEVYSAVRPMHKDAVLIGYNYDAPTYYTLKKIDNPINTSQINEKPVDHSASWVISQMHKELADFSLVVKPSKKPTAAATPNELVAAVLSLSPQMKTDILFQVTNPQYLAANKQAKDLIKLALFYEPTWLEFLENAAKHPQENDALFNALVPVFKAMPNELRLNLQSRISNKYAEVGDKAWVRKGWLLKKVYGVLSPRDALDVVSNQLFPAKTAIEDQLKKGIPVEAAYSEFLVIQNKRFYTKTKIKAYRSDYIKSIALKIQSAIQSHPEIFGPSPLYIVGRFPNGRSDISDFGLELIVADPLNKKAQHELSFAINGTKKPHAKDFIDVEFLPSQVTTVKEAIVNPIQIKVTADTIELHVHEPIKNLDRDQFQLPKNYPAPAVFSIPLNHQMATLKEAS